MVQVTIDVPQIVIDYVNQYKGNDTAVQFTIKALKEKIVKLKSAEVVTEKNSEIDTYTQTKQQEIRTALENLNDQLE